MQTTVEVPTWKLEPDGGVQFTVAGGQFSTTVGAGYDTNAAHWPGLAFADWFGGQTNTGGTRSFTVIVKPQVSLFPEASVAMQITGLVPIPQKVPEGGTHTTEVPGQLSTATGSV
jgi:hypothetical protein